MNMNNDQFPCILRKNKYLKKVIMKYETGTAILDTEIIQILADLYDLNFDALMFETTQEQNKDTCERSSFYQRSKEIMEYRSMRPTELSIASGNNILEIDAY